MFASSFSTAAFGGGHSKNVFWRVELLYLIKKVQKNCENLNLNHYYIYMALLILLFTQSILPVTWQFILRIFCMEFDFGRQKRNFQLKKVKA